MVSTGLCLGSVNIQGINVVCQANYVNKVRLDNTHKDKRHHGEHNETINPHQ